MQDRIKPPPGGRSGAATARGAATRAKLIEAGRKAFSTYGYNVARIADVTRIADVSHGNFYRHFTDKDDLLHVILADLHDDLRRPSAVKAARGQPSLLEDMIDRNTRFFHTYTENRHMLRVAREAAAQHTPNPFLKTWLEMRVPFIERNRQWMMRIQQSGLIRAEVDVLLMAEALGSMVEQLAYVKIGLPETEPTTGEIEEMGRTCGLIWFRSIFEAESDGPVPHRMDRELKEAGNRK